MFFMTLSATLVLVPILFGVPAQLCPLQSGCSLDFTRTHAPPGGVWWVRGEHRTASGTADLLHPELGVVRVEVVSEGPGPQALRVPSDAQIGDVYRTNREMLTNPCLDQPSCERPSGLAVVRGTIPDREAPIMRRAVLRYEERHLSAGGGLSIQAPGFERPFSVALAAWQRLVPVLHLELEAAAPPLIDLLLARGEGAPTSSPYPLLSKALPLGPEEQRLSTDQAGPALIIPTVTQTANGVHSIRIEFPTNVAEGERRELLLTFYDPDTGARSEEYSLGINVPPGRTIYGLFCACSGTPAPAIHAWPLTLLVLALVNLQIRRRAKWAKVRVDGSGSELTKGCC